MDLFDEIEEEETNVGLVNRDRPITSSLDKTFSAEGVLISTFLGPDPNKETLRGTSVFLVLLIYGHLDKHCPFWTRSTHTFAGHQSHSLQSFSSRFE